ncbi:unnamed protein product [Sphagnum jensenii]|uniref:OVATE domain-containing protein n=1 Tax=Sphagnum jensenii TaxID=128206 RepID=A0ABP0WP27_9BRYO
MHVEEYGYCGDRSLRLLQDIMIRELASGAMHHQAARSSYIRLPSSPIDHKVLDTPFPVLVPAPAAGCKHNVNMLQQPARTSPSPRKSTTVAVPPRNPPSPSAGHQQLHHESMNSPVEIGCRDYSWSQLLAPAFRCKQIEEEDVVVPKAHASFSAGSGLHRAVSRVRDLKPRNRVHGRTRHVSLDMDYDDIRSCSVEAGSTAASSQYCSLADHRWGCKQLGSSKLRENRSASDRPQVETLSMGADVNDLGADSEAKKHQAQLLKKRKDSRSCSKKDEPQLRAAGDGNSSSPESSCVTATPQNMSCCQTYLQNPGRALAMRQDAIECFECTPRRLSNWFAAASHYIAATEKILPSRDRSSSASPPASTDDSIFTTSLEDQRAGVSKDHIIATKIQSWSCSDSSSGGITSSSGELDKAAPQIELSLDADHAAGRKLVGSASRVCKQNRVIPGANVKLQLGDSGTISDEISPPPAVPSRRTRNWNHHDLQRQTSFQKQQLTSCSPGAARAKRNTHCNRCNSRRRESFPVFQSDRDHATKSRVQTPGAAAFNRTRPRESSNADFHVVKEIMGANSSLEASNIARKEQARAPAKQQNHNLTGLAAAQKEFLPERMKTSVQNLKCGPADREQLRLVLEHHETSLTTTRTRSKSSSGAAGNLDHDGDHQEARNLRTTSWYLQRPDQMLLEAVNGVVKESVAMVKTSCNPYNDFKESMIEMIVEKDIQDSDDLEELLQCYLSLNAVQFHGVIVDVFTEVWRNIFSTEAASRD